MARVVDDHNFRVREGPGRHGTCRLQVLRGTRSGSVVVVITQVPGDVGVNVVNAAEAYAHALREAYVLDVPGRPPFVAHLVESPDDPVWQWLRWTVLDPNRHRPEAQPRLATPTGDCSQGGGASRRPDPRGSGYLAVFPAPQTSADWRLSAPFADLPSTHPFRTDWMLVATRRAWRPRLQQSAATRQCDCSYHQGSWKRASRLALSALRAGHATSLIEPGGVQDPTAGRELYEDVKARACAQLTGRANGRLDAWTIAAVVAGQ